MDCARFDQEVGDLVEWRDEREMLAKLRGLLAFFGLDFLIDVVEGSAEWSWFKAAVGGLWTYFAAADIAGVWKYLKEILLRLRGKLVEQGAEEAAEKLGGVFGKLVKKLAGPLGVALMALDVYLAIRTYLEASGRADEVFRQRLRELYDAAADCPDRDKILGKHGVRVS